MATFTVVLKTDHGNTERLIQADDGLLLENGHLVFSKNGPEPDLPGDTVAMFAPGSWTHFFVDTEGV